MPLWIQVLQALLTPAIALAVGIVGFLQWRTAHQKVVLDLFDRRWAVYRRVDDFHTKIVTGGERHDVLFINSFHHVRGEAAFLFGADVDRLLESIHLASINIVTHMASSEGREGDEFRAYRKAAAAELHSLISLGQTIQPTFARYMRMDQKLVPTPAAWLAECNRQRLSYADEKQK